MPHRIVSFVIRTKNESRLLGQCLEQIRAQQWGGRIEIVVVDSGSTDGTVDIARRWADKVIEIPAQDFHYSKTLNLGIRESSGSIVLPLSGHTVIKGDRWLAGMVEAFEEPRLAGVSCRQIAWPDADWTEVHRIASSFPASDRTWDGNDDGMFFSNAASAVRRDVWESNPFDRTSAEDYYWAKWAVSSGYVIKYLGGLEAYHSHTDTPRIRAKRVAEMEYSSERAQHGPIGFLGTLRLTAGMLWRSSLLLLKTPARPSVRVRYFSEILSQAYWFFVLFRRLNKHGRLD